MSPRAWCGAPRAVPGRADRTFVGSATIVTSRPLFRGTRGGAPRSGGCYAGSGRRIPARARKTAPERGLPLARIRVLPPEVARRIAAGEVIERPASVVKELCENAVDAGARRVTVDLTDGGLAEIVVTDDGCGMDPEDALVAFERHATSKLERFEDLEGLQTLGFRGEALPSIAAVARVEMVTRPEERPDASVVRIAGGGPPERGTAGASPGTRLGVRDLFFNLPARRAALRSPGQELAAVTETVQAGALARPDVAFHLTHNGREVLATPGDGELLSAVVALWGPEVGRAMLPVAGRSDGWEVVGLCGTPARARGNRGIQFLSVDGRPVRSDAVRGAIEGAYHNLLMVHRYPLFVLRLAAAPGQYDANVHPSKREVRLYRPERVRDLCHRAVRAALHQADLIPGLAPTAAAALERLPDAPPRPSYLRFAFQAQASEGGATYRPDLPPTPPPGGDPSRGEGGAARTEAAAAAGLRDTPVADSGNAPSAGAERSPLVGASRLPALRPLGQIADAYIVAEGDDGLYLIDQHAAHERVQFEALSARVDRPAAPLLQPVAVRLTAHQWERWERDRAALAEAGLATEEFGPGTVLVRTVPLGLPDDPAAVLAAVLDGLDGAAPGPVAARLALAACKAAIKAGRRLGPGEAVALLDSLGACADPFHCPHGRPTVLRLGLGELERHFGRR